jgi:hypothetical protein
MAEFGDTLEKIAADEMARLRQLPDVLHWIPDKVQAKARQAVMLKQLDDECHNRRDAVNKRLKHALALEMQAAKDMRSVKRPAKHPRFAIEHGTDASSGFAPGADSDEHPGDGSSDKPKEPSWRKVCPEEPQEVWDDITAAHAVVVAAIAYSKPLAAGWPPAGRGQGVLATGKNPRKWTDTAGNMWAVGQVQAGKNKGKFGLFVKTGQPEFNVNARHDAVSLAISIDITHDITRDIPIC